MVNVLLDSPTSRGKERSKFSAICLKGKRILQI